MSKDGYEYLLSIPYDTEEELERIIYSEIYAEIESLADYRHCFIKVDIAKSTTRKGVGNVRQPLALTPIRYS